MLSWLWKGPGEPVIPTLLPVDPGWCLTKCFTRFGCQRLLPSPVVLISPEDEVLSSRSLEGCFWVYVLRPAHVLLTEHFLEVFLLLST